MTKITYINKYDKKNYIYRHIWQKNTYIDVKNKKIHIRRKVQKSTYITIYDKNYLYINEYDNKITYIDVHYKKVHI